MIKSNKGFSLIELMIVMVIVGVLATIMLPSYRQYVTESRRSDGVAMLMNVMQQQERYYTERLTYTSDLADLGFDTTSGVESGNGNYQIEVAMCGSVPTDPSSTSPPPAPSISLERCVLLKAVAQGEQVTDGDLTLDSRGHRKPDSHWR